MSHNRNFRTLGAALLVSIMVILVVPCGWARSKYKTLYQFTGGADGNEYFPIVTQGNWFSAGLTLDSLGNLYGTTAAGGVYGYGVAFELAPSTGGTWTETVLYSFTGGADGAYPLSALVLDAAGNLYGTTSAGGRESCSNFYGSGCGVVFKLTRNSDRTWTQSVLYSFTGGADGAQPEAALIFDSTGNLYGTTDAGGLMLSAPCPGPYSYNYDNGCGVAFKLTPNSNGSWAESVLYSFTGGDDGGSQIGPLIFDTVGNLYGTAQHGKYGQGVVFKLTPAAGSWSESLLHVFTLHRDGSDPFSFAGLVFDATGDLYGTTFWLPNFGGGTVFKLTPTFSGPWQWSLVHDFGTANTYHPVAGVIFDHRGNLYGTTVFGGSIGCGVVFKLMPTSSGGWKEGVVHNFVDHPGCDGGPGLVIDPAGNVYGVTLGDGSKTFGSVYKITP